MDWFKHNPFVGILLAATLVLGGGAIYFALSALSALNEQRDAFQANTGELASLQSGKPFPDEDNLRAAEAELAAARQILSDLAKMVAEQSAPLDPNLTPQRFQDALNTRVAALTAQATEAGVTLPENFYLGFDEYRTQLPSVPAAPLLGQQLESISEAIGLLITARVRAVSSVARASLPIENAAPKADAPQNDLALAPFEIVFVSDQTSLRLATTSLIQAKPLLLLRSLEVVNSNPSAPSKADATPAATQPDQGDDEKAPTEIPVVFGQETLTVRWSLAAVSTTAEPSPEP